MSARFNVVLSDDLNRDIDKAIAEHTDVAQVDPETSRKHEPGIQVVGKHPARAGGTTARSGVAGAVHGHHALALAAVDRRRTCHAQRPGSTQT